MSEGANTRQAVRADCEVGEPVSATGDAAAVDRTRRKAQTPRRVVVVGEFNSGKTSLVNALLGAAVLKPSFVVRTVHPTVVGYAAKPSLSGETGDRKRIRLAWDAVDDAVALDIRRLHVGMPLERLRSVRVIDTPGLAWGDDSSDRRTLQLCRNADTVIWCTPALQAWKASEERAWLSLSQRTRHRGILAVTFEDTIDSSADANRLLARLRAEAGPHFGKIVFASEHAALMPLPSEHEIVSKRSWGGVVASTPAGAAAGQLR
jgi:hypothetical protein